jgi:acyl-CoA synthetase (NDP forming)
VTATSSLGALFAPRSIAFIGASERVNAPATRGLRHCLRLGFEGTLLAVNPKHETLFGVRCLPDARQLPEGLDLAVIALPADGTFAALEACVARGVRAAIVCSSGWGEAGKAGKARERELERLIAGRDLRVLGPNCIGAGAAAARYCVAYNSSFEHVAFRHPRPIGVVCQSGAMLGGMLLNAEDAGVGVAAFAHVGNGTDIGLEEVAAHLLERDDIHTLALLIEGLHDPQGFVALARQAHAIGKRVAVFKAGRSDVGQRAVTSHTGAIAGADDVFDAVCRDEGVLRIDEPEDLLPAARLLAQAYRPAGRRVLVFTLSGGGASVLADELTAAGLEMPAPTQATVEACARLDNPFLEASNPFDVGSSVFSDPGAPKTALAIAARDANVDAICWIGVGAPRDERSSTLLDDALDVLGGCGKPAVIVPLSGTPVEAGFACAHEIDVPVARSVKAAALLMRAALSHGEARPAAAAPHTAGATGGRVLRETEAKRELAARGIPVLEAHYATDTDEVASVASSVGFPLVLKGVAPGVAHKSEAGLVKVGLRDAAATRAAAEDMIRRNPGTRIEGFTVETQLVGGVETLLGIRMDAQFGPMLVFGLGGTMVEVLRDIALTACPCTPERARALIGETRAARLLDGFRGAPAADVEALVAAMVRLSRYAVEAANEVLEVEMNPFIVLPRGRGAFAVDALIVKNT